MTKKYNIRQAKVLRDVSKIKVLTCSVNWDIKSLVKDASGQLFIEGWANTADKDRIGDVVLPSAFLDTIKEFMDNPVLLYQHDWEKIIGHVVEFKIIDSEKEETNGLWIKACLSNAKDVEDVKTKIKEGSLKTFSIGYNELDADYDKQTETNIVTKLELLEISVVTIPCNPFAKFGAIGEEKAGVSKELIDFLSGAIKELKDIGEVSSDFLQEVINIFNNKE